MSDILNYIALSWMGWHSSTLMLRNRSDNDRALGMVLIVLGCILAGVGMASELIGESLP